MTQINPHFEEIPEISPSNIRRRINIYSNNGNVKSGSESGSINSNLDSRATWPLRWVDRATIITKFMSFESGVVNY